MGPAAPASPTATATGRATAARQISRAIQPIAVAAALSAPATTGRRRAWPGLAVEHAIRVSPTATPSAEMVARPLTLDRRGQLRVVRTLLRCRTCMRRGRLQLSRMTTDVRNAPFSQSQKRTMLMPMTTRVVLLGAMLSIARPGPAHRPVRISPGSRRLRDLQELKQRSASYSSDSRFRSKRCRLPRPPPKMVKLKLGTEFSLGRADAPVTMVEFNDP